MPEVRSNSWSQIISPQIFVLLLGVDFKKKTTGFKCSKNKSGVRLLYLPTIYYFEPNIGGLQRGVKKLQRAIFPLLLYKMNIDSSLSKAEVFNQVGNWLKSQQYPVVKEDQSRPWGGFFVLEESQIEKFRNQFFPTVQFSESQLLNKLSPKILVVSPDNGYPGSITTGGQRLSLIHI